MKKVLFLTALALAFAAAPVHAGGLALSWSLTPRVVVAPAYYTPVPAAVAPSVVYAAPAVTYAVPSVNYAAPAVAPVYVQPYAVYRPWLAPRVIYPYYTAPSAVPALAPATDTAAFQTQIDQLSVILNHEARMRALEKPGSGAVLTPHVKPVPDNPKP